MDRMLVLEAFVLLGAIILGLVVSVDFRAAVFGLFGVKPIYPVHPSADIFGLNLSVASYDQLNAKYDALRAAAKAASRFPELDEQRLALAYARAVGALNQREARRLLESRVR